MRIGQALMYVQSIEDVLKNKYKININDDETILKHTGYIENKLNTKNYIHA